MALFVHPIPSGDYRFGSGGPIGCFRKSIATKRGSRALALKWRRAGRWGRLPRGWVRPLGSPRIVLEKTQKIKRGAWPKKKKLNARKKKCDSSSWFMNIGQKNLARCQLVEGSNASSEIGHLSSIFVPNSLLFMIQCGWKRNSRYVVVRTCFNMPYYRGFQSIKSVSNWSYEPFTRHTYEISTCIGIYGVGSFHGEICEPVYFNDWTDGAIVFFQLSMLFISSDKTQKNY